jgi:hypothetical protein
LDLGVDKEANAGDGAARVAGGMHSALHRQRQLRAQGDFDVVVVRGRRRQGQLDGRGLDDLEEARWDGPGQQREPRNNLMHHSQRLKKKKKKKKKDREKRERRQEERKKKPKVRGGGKGGEETDRESANLGVVGLQIGQGQLRESCKLAVVMAAHGVARLLAGSRRACQHGQGGDGGREVNPRCAMPKAKS